MVFLKGMSVKVLKLFAMVISLSGIVSCQTAAKNEYDRILRSASDTEKVYAGFHQAFEATVYKLDINTQNAVLERKGLLLEWPISEVETQKSKARDERLTNSFFYMRFFAPDPIYNDLHQPDTIWKVYLIVGNQKYEAIVKKDFSKLADQQALFPNFDRFSTGYELSFPIGQASLDGQPHQILLTSSLGKAEFSF